MANKDKNIIFSCTGGDFIDPTDCGSFIRYKGHATTWKGSTSDKDYIRSEFSMYLGDCNRVINWDFIEYENDEYELKLAKIDAVIKIMQDARASIMMMNKIMKKENERIAKVKEQAKK